MLLGAQHKPLEASSLVIGGRGKLLGYSVTESAGSPAVASVILYDGTSTGGQIINRIKLAASGSANTWFGPQGIQFQAGLYVGALTGELVGTFYFIAEELVGPHSLVQANGADARISMHTTLGELTQLIGEIN